MMKKIVFFTGAGMSKESGLPPSVAKVAYGMR